ncbi:hypothetical protein ALC60_06564 [Trachymyrmex zeteki]|uniref:Uncharacterized protein n=1 Tax=Mycetomoellerius zeteki TaxID=64791 RepID=A0A151X2C3_9HYME|nr:hypothetical protein ALC60_06564 [Trachymyrmex zeteki]
MAPVAEMTYFDSGTIEHLTYRVVAAKEYSDGSVGGGRSSLLYAYMGIFLVREREVIRYQAAVMASLQSHSNFESEYSRAGARSSKPRVPNRSLLYIFYLASSKTSNCLETRRSPKKRNAGRIRI